MKFFKIARKFHEAEDGAVTVDWVVLTAAIVGLGMVVMTTVGGGIESLGGEIVTDLSNQSINGYGTNN